jgi:hypothetical protein
LHVLLDVRSLAAGNVSDFIFWQITGISATIAARSSRAESQ